MPLNNPTLTSVLDDLESALDKAASLQCSSLKTIRAAADSVINELYDSGSKKPHAKRSA